MVKFVKSLPASLFPARPEDAILRQVRLFRMEAASNHGRHLKKGQDLKG